jgi:hypothetical protein
MELKEFKDALDKAADYHYDMSRSLLRKLGERDQEIIRLRTLLSEHGIDPTQATRQMEMNLAELGKRFSSMEKKLDNIDKSVW